MWEGVRGVDMCMCYFAHLHISSPFPLVSHQSNNINLPIPLTPSTNTQHPQLSMSPAEAVACVEKFPSLLALADGGSRRGSGSVGMGGMGMGMGGMGVGGVGVGGVEVGVEGSGTGGAEGRDGFGSVTSGGLAARIDRLYTALVRGGILAPPSPHAAPPSPHASSAASNMSAASAVSSSSASFSLPVPVPLVLDEGAQALLRKIVTQCPRVRQGVGGVWGCIWGL